MEEYLTITELSARIKFSKQSLYNLIHKGTFVFVDCRDLIPKNYHDFYLSGKSWNPAVINHRVPCRQQSTALSYPLASESPLVCLRFTQISLSDRN